jgi:hypothetical protein
MTREFFNGEYAQLAAQWAKDATSALAEVWFQKFQYMTETRFRATVRAILDTCDRMPSIHKAYDIAEKKARPAVANKNAIDALFIHAKVIAEHNSSMCESSVMWLVEMHTGQEWPKAVTDDRLEELKAMLDRVDDVAWEVLTYRSYVLSLGVLEAADALCRNYGTELAEQMMVRAKEAMPGLDAPPTHTNVYRHEHEQRQPELVGKAFEDPWYNRE